MIEWTKNAIKKVIERPYNDPGKGESIGSPFFVFEQVILEGGVTSGVTKWGYIFSKLGLHF